MITVGAAALSSSGKGMGSRRRRQNGRGHEDRPSDAHARQAAGWEPAAELDHVGPVGIEVARRLGCDASVMRVIMAAPSEPLDVGRRTPLVPTGIRRALIARGGTCRFPGCDRPHA
jgi:hypothetical protein